MSKKKRFILYILILLLILVIIGTGGFYLLFTKAGGGLVVETALNRAVPGDSFEANASSGSLAEGLVYENLVFQNMTGWPEGAELKIQRFMIRLKGLDINDAELEIHNARLALPFSEPIVFFGQYRDRLFKGNVFTSEVSVDQALRVFDVRDVFVKGDISKIDIYLEGPLNKIAINGKFTLKDLTFKKIHVEGVHSRISGEIEFNPITTKIDSNVLIALKDGKISTRGLNLSVDESRIKLENNAKDILLDIRAFTYVKKVRVNVNVTGTREFPDIRLVSTPSYPPETIMSMLITGKVPDPQAGVGMRSGLAPEVAKDALDYYMFAGGGSILAQKIGLTDVSILYEKGQRGVGVTKAVSDQLDLGYEVKQVDQRDGTITLDQKIGGEFKVTDSVSVSVDKAISTPQQQEHTVDQRPVSRTEETILLKYKKDF